MKFRTALLFVSLLISSTANNAFAGGMNLEEAMRATQDRYHAVYGANNYITWPGRSTDGADATYYPTNGFYSEELKDPPSAAYLVKYVANYVQLLGDSYWDSEDGDLSGRSERPQPKEYVKATMRSLLADQIKTTNYVPLFLRCGMRYAK